MLDDGDCYEAKIDEASSKASSEPGLNDNIQRAHLYIAPKLQLNVHVGGRGDRCVGQTLGSIYHRWVTRWNACSSDDDRCS
jgi:hypothetical protein